MHMKIPYATTIPSIVVSQESNELSTKDNSNDDLNAHDRRRSFKQRRNCKLIVNSILLFSIFILIACKASVKQFLFYEILILMSLFDFYYVYIYFTSKSLHWFHYDLTGINLGGNISMAIPTKNSLKENKFRLIGSISELSCYPGSTSNYIINTISSYVCILTWIFGILILNDNYENYNFSKYSSEIIQLILICLASFGFLLAGHWSVFETRIATILHIIGFLMAFLFPMIAIIIQTKGHWLSIVASIVSIGLIVVYMKIRIKWVLVEFQDTIDAHKYSLKLNVLELIAVMIVQAECLAFVYKLM